MSVKVSVTGLNEIDTLLKKLPDNVKHSVLSSAHANAAKPLVTKMQLLAPEGPTGNLVDSVGVVKMNIKRANAVGEVRVGPRRKGRYKGYAGHLVEFGTKQRYTRGRGKYRAGASRGIMPKKPFVEPSFHQTKTQVEKNIAVSIGKSMVRTMRRYARR